MASDRGPRNLRQDATETAAAMFAEAGYDGISMREIAQALGVSKAALYYHFADKQSLMLAVLEEYLAEIERVLDETLPTQGDCREQIVALVRAIFSLPPGQRAVMRLASQEIGKLA
ncbi:TetR/AcrR family transcriptional regulator, partial [Salinispira pacifica]